MGIRKPPTNLKGGALARRNALALSHFGLVHSVVRGMGRHLSVHVDHDDIIGAGVFGLLKAAEHFDPARGVAFKTFASHRIRGAVLDHVRTMDALSRDSRRMSNEIKDAKERLGPSPTAEEIAAKLGITIEELYRRLARLTGDKRTVSLDDSADIGDRLTDASAVDGLATVLKREMATTLEAAICRLPMKMQRVLSLYYFDGLRGSDVGKVMGFTESRACQILKQATAMLREMLDPAMGDA